MARRIQQLTSALCSLTITPLAPPATLLPRAHQQRSLSILSRIHDVRSSYNKRKRVGRGPASGKGKTSGRGHKGQNARGSGPPHHLVDPERIKTLQQGQKHIGNPLRRELTLLNVDTLQRWIRKGRIDPKRPITMRELADSRCVHGIKDGGIKLLARNADRMKTPVDIIVSRASAKAIAAVEAAGGSVTTRYYSDWSIGRIRKGETHPIASVDAIGGPLEAIYPMSKLVPDPNNKGQQRRVPMLPNMRFRLPDATSRKDKEYYRNPAKKGYLVHTVQEGQGPSLFFKPPRDATEPRGARKAKAMDANRLF